MLTGQELEQQMKGRDHVSCPKSPTTGTERGSQSQANFTHTGKHGVSGKVTAQETLAILAWS